MNITPRTYTTALGCVPIIGSIVGIGRIAIALNNIFNTSVNANDKQIQKLQSNNRQEIIHGLAEIVPIVGPMLYGATTGMILLARKVNDWSTEKNITPLSPLILEARS